MNKLVKILLSWIALFALASGSMALTGCSKDEDSVNPDLVKYDIRLDLNKESINDQELKSIAAKINNNEQVSHNLVSKKFQEYHAIDMAAADVTTFIKEISKGLKGSDPFARKTAYEASIEEMAGGALVYNRTASSVSHIIMQNKMQCYSGTSLNMMVNRELEDGITYEGKNYVVIFQAGHILPGMMIKANGQWVLIGIETTSTGVATHNFGLASELQYGKTRVVEASYFMLIEMYKAYLLSPASTADTAIEKTAKKYGIDLTNYGPTAKGTGGSSVGSVCDTSNSPFGSLTGMEESVDYASAKINLSPFGFGCSSVTDDEDKLREENKGIGSSVSEVTAVSLKQIQAMQKPVAKAAPRKARGFMLAEGFRPEELFVHGDTNISLEQNAAYNGFIAVETYPGEKPLVNFEITNEHSDHLTVDIDCKDEEIEFNRPVPHVKRCKITATSTCSSEVGEYRVETRWFTDTEGLSKQKDFFFSIEKNPSCEAEDRAVNLEELGPKAASALMFYGSHYTTFSRDKNLMTIPFQFNSRIEGDNIHDIRIAGMDKGIDAEIKCDKATKYSNKEGEQVRHCNLLVNITCDSEVRNYNIDIEAKSEKTSGVYETYISYGVEPYSKNCSSSENLEDAQSQKD